MLFSSWRIWRISTSFHRQHTDIIYNQQASITASIAVITAEVRVAAEGPERHTLTAPHSAGCTKIREATFGMQIELHAQQDREIENWKFE